MRDEQGRIWTVRRDMDAPITRAELRRVIQAGRDYTSGPTSAALGMMLEALK
jgi:hypothetical protein